MANEIHLNDIGTIFEITLYDCEIILPDLPDATSLIIKFQKPDKKTTVDQPAEFKTDGTDGIVQYTTLNGDLDKTGNWKIQAFVITPSGSWHSDIGKFKVYSNL